MGFLITEEDSQKRIRILSGRSYYGWGLKVRDHYNKIQYPNLPKMRKVPELRQHRAPSEFLEDAIKNLQEDMDEKLSKTL